MVALVQGWVETLGLETESASNGAEALQVARRFVPDIIVMDAMMPIMGGFEALVELKRDPLLREIAVLFLTVRDEIQDIMNALDMGAHDYLKKPFKPQELLARLKAILRQKQEQDRLRQQIHEAEHERDRLLGWLERIPAGLLTLDGSGRVVSWRGPELAEEEVRGLPAGEVLDCQGASPWQEALPYEGPARILSGTGPRKARALGRPLPGSDPGAYELLLIPS